MTLTPAARNALHRIANGDGSAVNHTRQMIGRLSRDGLIDFDLATFQYVATQAGHNALGETA
jgi:hypothetical protein